MRPPLTKDLSSHEFERWYWLREELADFARALGIRATGGKRVLTGRISAALDQREFAEPPAKQSRSAQLSGVLRPDTVIPAGQRCSQLVRSWLVEQVGPGFRFDAAMRDFFANTDGSQTMQDALDHWRNTRDQSEKSIDRQFEYNRFTRAWHKTHPEGSRAQLLAAWSDYRSQPIDERGLA